MTTDHGDTILVAYATKHGSTKQVAEAIAAQLERDGHAVDLRPAADVRQLRGYIGVVLGGSLYTGRWRGDCSRFLRRHKNELGSVKASIPVQPHAGFGRPRLGGDQALGRSGRRGDHG